MRIIEELKKYMTRIQETDRKKISEISRVTVIGVGGVGTWAGIMMALVVMPGTEIILIDPDELGPENMNRLPYPAAAFMARMNKAVALAKYITSIRPAVKATPVPAGWGDLPGEVIEAVRASDVIIEATDNPAVQDEIYRWARIAYRGPLVAAHYDGKSLSIQYHPRGIISSWVINWEAGYRVVPSYPTVAVLVASMAVDVAIARPGEPLTISFSLPSAKA